MRLHVSRLHVQVFERDSVHLWLFRGEWRSLERGQLVEELLACESRRFGHKCAGEDVCPDGLSDMSGRGVGAILELELEKYTVFSERHAMILS
jgi:hypothetical protein